MKTRLDLKQLLQTMHASRVELAQRLAEAPFGTPTDAVVSQGRMDTHRGGARIGDSLVVASPLVTDNSVQFLRSIPAFLTARVMQPKGSGVNMDEMPPPAGGAAAL